MTFCLLEGTLGLRLLASMVARRSLIKCVALLFECLPMATGALVVARMIPSALHVTSLELFV